MFAIRVPTNLCGWLRDTWLLPQSLADARDAHLRLTRELAVWRRFLAVRPESRFVDVLLRALAPLTTSPKSGSDLAEAISESLAALEACRDRFRDDAPFVAVPYTQMPAPDGIVVRAESLFDRPATLTLTGPGGAVSEHHHSEATRYHRFVLAGLQPDTEYDCRVSAGDVECPAISFRTAPEGFRPFTAVVWGDSHYGPEVLEGIAKHVAELRPDLLLIPGDVVGDGYYEWEFIDHLLHPIRYAKGVAPLHFAVGNHDHGSWGQHGITRSEYLEARFEPTGEAEGQNPYCYSLRYAGCWFGFIDPYHGRVNRSADGLNAGRPQYEWLKADLESVRDARWKLIFVHEPPFCETWEGGYYDGEPDLREHLVPLMEEHGVDVCVSGHAHTYERGIPHPPYDPETGEGTPWPTSSPAAAALSSTTGSTGSGRR